MTWHQWHAEYPTDKKTGRFSARARSKASSPHGYQSTGLSRVLAEIRARLRGQSVHPCEPTAPARGGGPPARTRRAAPVAPAVAGAPKPGGPDSRWPGAIAGPS